MARFIDVHSNMKGITEEQLREAHARDHQHQGAEGVKFVKAWADPSTGKVFCLSEGPNKDAIRRVHQKAGHPTTEIYEVPVEIE